MKNDMEKMQDELNPSMKLLLSNLKNIKLNINITKVKNETKQLNNILNKYEFILLNRKDEFEKKLYMVDMPEDGKSEFMERVCRRHKKVGSRNRKSILKVERDIVQTCYNIFEFLNKKHGEYWVKRWKNFFVHQQDTDLFNIMIQNIIKLTKEEEQLIAKFNQDMQILQTKSKR